MQLTVLVESLCLEPAAQGQVAPAQEVHIEYRWAQVQLPYWLPTRLLCTGCRCPVLHVQVPRPACCAGQTSCLLKLPCCPA